MLGLTLREEFQGKRLKGTQIELAGATQQTAESFLKITYPTSDVLKAIEAIGPDKGRPLVLMADRGQGKSHVMAVLHHVLTDGKTTEKWLNNWSRMIDQPSITSIKIRHDMCVISESLHRQHYKYLWDLLFDKHPEGQRFRGRWEARGDKKTEVPDYTLILEMFQSQPTALILDEFQTWYEGLVDTPKLPAKKWAFNFIQILTDIAKEHPELLVLVVSVISGNSDAYLQIHRVNPDTINFKGPSANKDRLKLLLHRLFENREQVPPADIEQLLDVHISEFIKLSNSSSIDADRIRKDFVDTWPYSPSVMRLLEDQVLVATEAQETRDLIKILVDLYKSHGDKSTTITPADFSIEDENSGIAALLESVANTHHRDLREKALRNLEAVKEAVDPRDVPHLSEIISALWIRSLAIDKLSGAEPETLQIDITRSLSIDANQFNVELSHILDNSFNIHRVGNRLVFRQDVNAEARLRAATRNDKLFSDGSDSLQLAKQIRYVFGDTAAQKFQVIVLGKHWYTTPWADVEANEQPDAWDARIPLLVLPECPDNIHPTLGKWLKSYLLRNRNIVRFVIPKSGTENVYSDQELLQLARAVLKADEWRSEDAEYPRLFTKYQTELRNQIKDRFDRFAILQSWNFADPSKCKFHIEAHSEKGSRIPDAIDERINKDLFEPETFEEFILQAASNNSSVGNVIRELKEPRPAGEDCIPWLGEAEIKDNITRLCAAGLIAINLRGLGTLQRKVGEDEQSAWQTMKGKLGTGKHLDETTLMPPQATPASAGAPKPQTPLPTTSPAQPTANVAAAGGDQEEPDPAASLFGTGTTTTATLVPLSSAPTSSLNLIGQVESWGIGPATTVQSLQLDVDSLTGAQLVKLLKNLPDGLTYKLSLDKEES